MRSHSGNTEGRVVEEKTPKQGDKRRLSEALVATLPAPPKGNVVYYDAPNARGNNHVAGFGLRVTAAGARAYVLKYRTKSGRQRLYTIGAPEILSLSAARTRAKNLKAKITQGADPVGEEQSVRRAATVAELCEAFIEEYLPNKRPATQRDYRAMIANTVVPALGTLKTADVVFDDIATFHRRITRGTTKAKPAPYAANRTVALLSKLFGFAIKKRWRTDNPAKGIERNQEVKRTRYLKPEECIRLAEALSRYKWQQDADMIRLALLTGSRGRSEVCCARWADIDLKSGTWTKPASTTKQKTLHHLPLSRQRCNSWSS